MKKIYTIGRDEGCDIVIPDNTDVISRLHATIRVESNDKIYIIDQSLNGTYVNGMKMSSNVEIPVSRKDVISFAHIYELDWTLIPKYRGGVHLGILAGLVSLILLTGSIYVAFRYFNTTNDVESTSDDTSILDAPQPENDIIKPDTVVVRDTVVVEREVPVVEDVADCHDEVVEEPEDEVYNPIY